MIRFVQKIGRLRIIILITLFSILVSVLISCLIAYLQYDKTTFSFSILMGTVVPLIVAPLASWPVVNLLIQVSELEEKMRALATYDSLTGLLNRQAFLHDSNSFIRFAAREQIPLSVIILDLDKFKSINDSYGHPAGDEVLKHFGKTMKTIFRKSDLIGRIGGEEFALLLPNTSQKDAVTLSDRLHSLVRGSIIQYDQFSIKYTISIGLVSLLVNEVDTIESLLKNADKSLYFAKENGRDCTAIFEY